MSNKKVGDLPLCGFCNESISDETEYKTTCVVCNTKHNIHYGCAMKMIDSLFRKPFRDLPEDQKNERIQLKSKAVAFNNSKKIDFHCRLCNVQCFLCSTKVFHELHTCSAMTKTICTGCSNKWCNLLDVPTKKKSGLTECQQRYKDTPLLCLNCKQTQSRKERPVMRAGRGEDISRATSSRHEEVDNASFKFNILDNDISSDYCNTIDKYFGISQGSFQSKFDSFTTAAEHFENTFMFLPARVNNIFDFKLPDYIIDTLPVDQQESYQSHFATTGTGGLFITLEDIDRLLSGSEYLNDAIINFVMSCFNHFSFSKVGNDDVPPVIFGLTTDVQTMVPDSDNNRLYTMSKFHELSSEEVESYEDEYRNESGKWYTVIHKRFAAKAVQYSLQKTKQIPRFVTVVGHGLHWFTLCVDMLTKEDKGEEQTFFPMNNTFNRRGSTVDNLVYTIDNLGGNDSYAKCARLYYAKYFALYLAELRGDPGPISMDDLNGKDIRIASFITEKSYKDLVRTGEFKYRMFPIEIGKCGFQQIDAVNCGVFALINSLSLLKKTDVTSFIGSDSNMSKQLDIFRLTILSVIDEMWNKAFAHIYNDYQYHFKFPPNIEATPQNKKRWRDIHYLFHVGKFDYKEKTAPDIMTDDSIKEKNLAKCIKEHQKEQQEEQLRREKMRVESAGVLSRIKMRNKRSSDLGIKGQSKKAKTESSSTRSGISAIAAKLEKTTDEKLADKCSHEWVGDLIPLRNCFVTDVSQVKL